MIGHPLREGVDWNLNGANEIVQTKCHPLREGVDWNWINLSSLYWRVASPSTWGCGLKPGAVAQPVDHFLSPSTWGCGLKLAISCLVLVVVCHPLREGVDWNRAYESVYNCYYVTLYVRVWIETDILHEQGCDGLVTLYVRVWIETSERSEN